MPHHDALLQEILDEEKYPGNQAVYDRLIERLAEASALAFVGAGASFPLYPLWDQLIGQLADEPFRRGLGTEADKTYWLRKAGDKVEKPTRIEDLDLRFEPPPDKVATGIVPRVEVPGPMRALKIEPQLDDAKHPFYVKLRAEAQPELLRDGTVHFAVRGHRQGVENHEAGRHHVVWQCDFEEFPKVSRACRLRLA